MRTLLTRLFQSLGTHPLPNEPVVAVRKWH
jgi:hypothetical protein